MEGPEPQLSAGGIHLFAARFPQRCIKSGLDQGVEEGEAGTVLRTFTVKTLDRTERDKIDLAGELTQKLDQLGCLLGLIVQPFDERIFKGHQAFCFFKVEPARLD